MLSVPRSVCLGFWCLKLQSQVKAGTEIGKKAKVGTDHRGEVGGAGCEAWRGPQEGRASE